MTVVAAASTASQIEPGALGFLIVAGMGLALFFLFRSLNKQLHKITPDAAAGKRAVDEHRPQVEDQVKRTLRGAGRLAGRFAGPKSPPDPPA